MVQHAQDLEAVTLRKQGEGGEGGGQRSSHAECHMLILSRSNLNRKERESDWVKVWSPLLNLKGEDGKRREEGFRDRGRG